MDTAAEPKKIPTPCRGTTYAHYWTCSVAVRRCALYLQEYVVGRGVAETTCAGLARLHRATFGA